MSEDRKPLPRCPIERRIARLTAAKTRHARRTALARLEREVAALGDPIQPSASEEASRASNARIQAILEEMTKIGDGAG